MNNDSGHNKDGTPVGWISGGTTISRGHDHQFANTTFNRTLVKKEDENNTWTGNADYLPPSFTPSLPRLTDRPLTRIYRDPPITTLDDFTIDDIRAALQSHTIGNFVSSARLADAMTGDDRVASVLGTRVKGVLGLPFIVEPKPRRKDDSDAKKVARKVMRLWEAMCPRPQVAEFLQWGVQMGFALAEIIWSARGGMWIPTIRTWHPQLVYYRYDERCFYVITMDGPIRVTPGDGKWILYAPHGEYRGWMHGTVRTCASPWRYRTYAMRDWARHAEKHGYPWILARVPLNSSDVDKQRFFNSLNNLGTEPTIMTPEVDEKNKFDIDMLEAAHPAADVFEKLVVRCDTLISCGHLGQNLTTEIQGGSYAAATVHGQVRQDFLEADTRTLAQCLQQQLVRPFCVYNFQRGSRLVPQIRWDVVPPTDKQLSATTVVSFASALAQLTTAGFPLDVETFAAQFGVPINTSGDGVKLQPPAAPALQQSDMAVAVSNMQRQLSALMSSMRLA